MMASALESIRYRQSLSPIGGIVESDPRVDRGNYLYQDRCWLRNYFTEPLLALGEEEMVLKNLGFWRRAFEKSGDGFFRHNYHFQTGERFSKRCQIDNDAHWLIQVSLAFEALGNGTWFSPLGPMTFACADHIVSRQDPRLGLIRGVEERVVQGVDFPDCYSFYINRVCIAGLERAARIGERVGRQDRAAAWRKAADQARRGTDEHLWDEEKGAYAFLRFPNDAAPSLAQRLAHDESWGTWWAFIFDEQYTNRDSASFHARLKALYRTDPLIPELIDHRDPVTIRALLADGDDKPEFRYSGVGVSPAANALAAWILDSREGDSRRAAEIWGAIDKYPGDRDLLPEHINTLHPGRMKDYALWPDPRSVVDSGNLMHLTMFMTCAVRLFGADVFRAVR